MEGTIREPRKPRVQPQRFAPILAKTQTIHTGVAPIAFDCVKLIVVRAGRSRLFSEFGSQHIGVGDVVLLAANTLCGAEPEDWVTTSTLYLDRDYVIDQVFWQYAELFSNRHDASDFLDVQYTEPTQVIRIGAERAGLLMPWLDELAALSVDGLSPVRFYRAQALLFLILDVVAPYRAVTVARVTATQRFTGFPSQPRHRQFRPLRDEARHAAALLTGDVGRAWRITDLAFEVHLSASQLRRVFVQAFGKTPLAYLTMLRAERMAELLRTTDLLVTTIANDVGWVDPEFAARQFRRSIGVTPSEYRRISQTSVPE